MLHRHDDFPLHQSSLPVQHAAAGHPDAFDRYLFSGYRRDATAFFAAALGVYPNREIIDGAFSVAVDGVQHSTIVSGRLPGDRRTVIGALRVDVVEPMKVLRVRVDGDRAPIAADLTFRARTVAVEEPRFTMQRDHVSVFDYTRMTQWGTWEGELSVEGRAVAIDRSVLGSRDRSWGVRPVGEQVGRGAPPKTPPQSFRLSTPLNFEDCAAHFDVNEFADGRRWHGYGCLAPLLFDDDSDPTAAPIEMKSVDYAVDWEPGTRRSQMASIILEPYEGDTHIIRLEPLLTFQMLGLGYGHPEWGHGCWRGENEQTSWQTRLDEVDPQDPTSLHVQQVVRARWGTRVGIGVFEQFAMGNHDPTGLTGLFDGASG